MYFTIFLKFEWVMSMHGIETHDTLKSIMSYICMQYITHLNESYYTYE